MFSYPPDDWRFVLWSTFVMEFLARAALASVSPVLLADSRSGWENIYFALGESPTKSKFTPKSIVVTEVFNRLESIFPGFTSGDQDAAIVHVARRNEELHTGGLPCDRLGTSEWLPGFYKACRAILDVMAESLEDLFGPEEAVAAIQLIDAAEDKSGQAVRERIHAHQQRWNGHTSEEREQASLQAGVWATKQDGHRVDCPACGSAAIVTGSAISPPHTELKDGDVTETQQFLPSKFECVACALKISGLSSLMAAGVGDSYTSTHVYDPAEYFLSEEDFYEPDFNE